MCERETVYYACAMRYRFVARKRKRRKKRKRRRSRIALPVLSADSSLSFSLSICFNGRKLAAGLLFSSSFLFGGSPSRPPRRLRVVFPHQAGNDARARNLVHTRAIPDTRLILPPLVNRQPLNNRAIPFFFVSSSSIWRKGTGQPFFFFFYFCIFFSIRFFFFLQPSHFSRKRDLCFIFSILKFLTVSSFAIE